MDFIKEAFGIFLLKKSAINSCSKKKNAIWIGLGMVLLATILVALSYQIPSNIIPAPAFYSTIGFLIGYPIFAVIMLFISTGLLHGIAKMLGGKAKFTKLLIPITYTYIIGLIFSILLIIVRLTPPPVNIAIGLLILFIGILAGFWGIVVLIVIIKNVYKISGLKAFFVWLISLVVIFIITFVLVIIMTLYLIGTGAMPF